MEFVHRGAGKTALVGLGLQCVSVSERNDFQHYHIFPEIKPQNCMFLFL